MPPSWIARAETASDAPAIRAINLAAFPTALEADLVDALRDDPAWIPSLSIVTKDSDGAAVGYALMTRCRVGGTSALALGPCAVLPERQRTGAGSAAIRAGLLNARMLRESLVLVLGDADYYSRFGFTPASAYDIRSPFDTPGGALMALLLDPLRPVPSGTVEYAPPFGATA
jgi:putative acetyltransferase